MSVRTLHILLLARILGGFTKSIASEVCKFRTPSHITRVLYPRYYFKIVPMVL